MRAFRTSITALFASASAAAAAAASTNLNVTAIAAANGSSHFECWQLAAPFTSSAQAGIAGTETTALGAVTNITYNVVPAGYDSGNHNAPHNQWVVVLQGLAIVTLPGSNATAVAQPGETGVLFAADTPGGGGGGGSRAGHGSYYPGATETIFLQIPTADGGVPAHRVLSGLGPCAGQEYAVLRGWATEAL